MSAEIRSTSSANVTSPSEGIRQVLRGLNGIMGVFKRTFIFVGATAFVAAAIPLNILNRSVKLISFNKMCLFSGRGFGGKVRVMSKKLISVPYATFIQIFNSKALPSVEQERKEGLLATPLIKMTNSAFFKCKESNNFLMKYGASRWVGVWDLVLRVVARVADLAIGILAAVPNLITFGEIKSLNDFATNQLLFSGLINDVFDCAARIIWAKSF